jgi:hypothetical protein
MTNIRPYTDLNSLYSEWTQYRLLKLRHEITHYLEKVEKEPKLALERVTLENFINEQTEYLLRTTRQMIAPQEQQRILKAYGREAHYAAPRIWEIVQSLPEFEKLASSADSDRIWMPESFYWMDLLSSTEAIRLGRTLKSTMGSLYWAKKRQYYMGDELLRQGLNEMFLDWLGTSGLWDAYCKLN